MQNLNDQLLALESYIPSYGIANPAVSSGSVGWHIEHTLLTIRKILQAVRSSDPAGFKKSFKLNRAFVFTFGRIPRGRAKAPKVVVPDGDIDATTLGSSMYYTKQMLAEIASLADNQHFQHPFLGTMNKKATMKFLRVHTRHHIKIIKKIVDI